MSPKQRRLGNPRHSSRIEPRRTGTRAIMRMERWSSSTKSTRSRHPRGRSSTWGKRRSRTYQNNLYRKIHSVNKNRRAPLAEFESTRVENSPAVEIPPVGFEHRINSTSPRRFISSTIPATGIASRYLTSPTIKKSVRTIEDANGNLIVLEESEAITITGGAQEMPILSSSLQSNGNNLLEGFKKCVYNDFFKYPFIRELHFQVRRKRLLPIIQKPVKCVSLRESPLIYFSVSVTLSPNRVVHLEEPSTLNPQICYSLALKNCQFYIKRNSFLEFFLRIHAWTTVGENGGCV